MFSKEERIKRSKITHEKWRENNRKRLTANTLKWKKNNPIKYILTRTRFRAKKHKLDFTIDETDINIPDTCPVLGIPIYTINDLHLKRGPKFNSLSIDRIDNSKGYIKGNIRIMSHKANVMKNSATPEELLQFAYWVLLTYGHLIDKQIKGEI
jgi:hypothetical protein